MKINNTQTKARKLMAIVQKGHTWKGNILQLLAEKQSLYALDEEEIYKINLTDQFFRELKRAIKNKEILKIQINAKMRLGKSTVGIALGEFVFELLKQYFPEYMIGREFNVKNIARDEQEYMTKMRDPKLMYDIIVTDERNAMDETGENATVERAQKEVFSDVQAGRYVHNILISPEKVIDDNADIRLVIRNREDGLTNCKVYYKLSTGGYHNWVFLGFVIINVQNTIKNWTKVEKRFMKYIIDDYSDDKERERDRKYVEHWKNKDYYIDYMYRKYEKMELMNKEGVMRERDLGYAQFYMNVLDKMRNLVGIMNMANLKRIAKSYLEMEFRIKKVPFSMIGTEQGSERILGVLSLYKSLEDVKTKVTKTKILHDKKKMDDRTFKMNIKQLEDLGESLIKAIKLQEEEWMRYARLNDKYHKILK